MITGHIIPASDVSQFVDAFTFSGSYDLLISGSIAVGQGNIQPDAKVYIKQNLRVDGGITGSVTGSFKGDGTNITGIVSSSYALTASYALNGGNGGGDITSLNNFTSSYFTDSASFNARINNVYASESKYLLTSSYRTDSASFDSRIDALSVTPFKIQSGSNALTTFRNGNIIA